MVSHASQSEISRMKGRQIRAIYNRGAQEGALAVLPPRTCLIRWLNALLEEAEILREGDHHEMVDTCAGLLGAVILLLSEQAATLLQWSCCEPPPTLYGLLHDHALCRKWSVDKRISGWNLRR